jgi:hypothetical protein
MQSEQQQQDLTFQPRVNKKSAQMVSLKNQTAQQESFNGDNSNPTNVVERLYKDAADRIQKTMTRTESVNEQMNREHTFCPSISKTSQHMSEYNAMFFGNNKDFYERQQQFLEKQQENKELIKQ